MSWFKKNLEVNKAASFLSDNMAFFIMELMVHFQDDTFGKEFANNILKYRPYEIKGMLEKEYINSIYKPSSAIHQRDNDEIRKTTSNIIINFDACMTNYFKDKNESE